MSKYLVIGGSGFIGGHLVEYIKNGGMDDAYIYDIKPPEWFDEHRAIEYIPGDIMDFDHLEKSMAQADGVFDCSGILGSAETFDHVEKTIRVNFLGTLNALEAANRHNLPFVYLSLKNEWKNPYMITKRAATELVEMYAQYKGLQAVSLRGLNAYGPRQHWDPVKKFFPRILTKMLKGDEIEIYGDGLQIVDMIYVRDMVKIMSLTMESLRSPDGAVKAGDVFDVGSGRARTVKSVVDGLALWLHKNTEDGVKSKFTHLPMRPGEPHQAIALANPAYVSQKLDYYPETSWKEGLQLSYNWYKDHYQEGV